VTSQMPIPIPAGSEVSTSERTPGEASAPKRPAAAVASGSGWTAREGAWAVKAIVPSITLAAETISAAAGDISAAITAVSSGPRMKISSISTESSA
jgi:hypothetical protein